MSQFPIGRPGWTLEASILPRCPISVEVFMPANQLKVLGQNPGFGARILKQATMVGMRNISGILFLSFLAGCSGSGGSAPKAFCEAVLDYEDALPVADAAEQQELLEKVVPNTPADVRSDAETLLEGYERAGRGEDITTDEKRYQNASERLERYAIKNCNLYEKSRTPGL